MGFWGFGGPFADLPCRSYRRETSEMRGKTAGRESVKGWRRAVDKGFRKDEVSMILVTRLNEAPLIINSDLIEDIYVTPYTVIAMTTGQILRVRESASEVAQRIVEFGLSRPRPAGSRGTVPLR